MILYVKGDLFQSPAQVLVNKVNTVGVMEKYLKPLPIEVFIYPDRESVFVEHLNPQEPVHTPCKSN